MNHAEEQAHLRELSLWMLYVGLVAFLVPTVLFYPDFLERVFFGPQTYKSALLLFGPWVLVTLLTFAHDRFGRRD